MAKKQKIINAVGKRKRRTRAGQSHTNRRDRLLDREERSSRARDNSFYKPKQNIIREYI